MASVNKDVLVSEYRDGASLTELASAHNISVSTARHHVLKAGALRSRIEGIKNAALSGKLGSGLRGKTRVFSEQQKSNMSKAKLIWADENAKGFSLKQNGYREHTRGPNKGKSEHVTIMEKRIGRKILPDECVHHIDGNRSNNNENNLALVTLSGHARLHRFQDAISGKQREREENGRFS